MNSYRVTVSFGDGNPKNTVIQAQSGYEAHAQAMKQFAGARNVHVFGIQNQKVLSKSSMDSNLVYGSDHMIKPKQRFIPTVLQNNQINPLVFEAVRLRKQGLTQEKIASTLGISRGVVRRFLNASID